MNTGCKVVVCLFAAVAAWITRAEAPDTQWTWAQSGTTLTEVLPDPAPDGAVAWAFTLSSAGVLKVKTAGTSPALNFRTIPEDCPYDIVSLADNFLYGNKTIEEVYLPDTLKKLPSLAFYTATSLRVCDFTANSQLEEIGYLAVYTTKNTVQVRVTDNLKRLNKQATSGIDFLFDCQVFPDGFTHLDQDNELSVERVVFGGDDSHDMTWGTGSMTLRMSKSIKEVVFGAGVTGCTAPGFLYQGGTITNVVCKCPTGFTFGANFAKYATVLQYDFYGWPSGAPSMCYNRSQTRILAPRDNVTWKGLVSDPSLVTPWTSLTAAEKKVYTDAYGSELEPFGKVAATGATYEGFTLAAGAWIVFNKGEDIKVVSLAVSGEAGNYDPAEGEPSFSPAYGTIPDVVSTLGDKFTCTAPRYIGSDLICYEVTGYRLYGKDEVGDFTVVKSEGSFADDEPRVFEFDTSVQTEEAYKLLWLTGNKVGYRFTVNAPLWSGLGTWVTNTVPDLKGYFSAGSEVKMTAAGADGHPFVMWAVSEDEANATRHAATLTLTMTNTWTVRPIFKTDHWEFSAGSLSGDNYSGKICDGYFNLNSSLSKSTRRLTLLGDNAAANNTYSYAEELDFSKPVYFTGGTGADGQEVYLVNIPSRLVPGQYLARFRKISIGSSVEALVSICLWGTPPRDSARNLQELVFDGAPTLAASTIATCGNLRQITFRGGIPTFVGVALSGLTASAVRLTASHTNEDWKAFAADAANVKRWRACEPEQQEAFGTYHPGEAHPYGRIIGNGGKGIPTDQWFDFDQRQGMMILLR